MKELTKKEEKLYYAGGGISASFINSIVNGFNAVLDVGRYFGSALRRIFTGNMC